ncbi:MAG: twin-arginine translocase TatA/TatE family subunit [Acidimicrobiales bacterium]
MPSLPGGWELLIVLLVVLLLFGSTRLPKLARSMGEASKEFKKGIKDGSELTKGNDSVSAIEASKAVEASKAIEASKATEITMTQAELDALLSRERRAGQDG